MRDQKNVSGGVMVADPLEEMDRKLETLERLPLWSTLPREVRLAVAARMEPVSYGAGDAIIRRGETGRRFSVLLAGRADVRAAGADGAVTTVATMKPGDGFGEMALLGEELTSADVIAVEPCETLALDRAAFRELVSSQPVLLREFVRLLAQRVRASDAAIGVAKRREEDLTRFLREQSSDRYTTLVGKTKPMAELKKQIAARATRATPLLVRGERGAGKELVARLVHASGPRKGAPLVAVDCAQISESPWGDPLFGTYGQDAAAHARGLSHVALADGGTLLLENVQALPAGLQQRLVQLLGGAPLPGGAPPDVRVIATCRTDLDADARAGRFSGELAALLLADVLDVPPLRERKRDIPELAAHFAARHAKRQGKGVPALDDEALTKLVSYDYPFANAAELEEAIERAVILTDGETIHAETIFLGPPPLSKPHGFDLLKLPRPLVSAALRLFPGALRAMAALVFAFLVVACFVLPSGPRGNAATVVVWAVWWPALALSFFFAGRAWCAICPMATSGLLARKLARVWGRAERRVPAWIKEHDTSLVMAGFFLIVWVEEVARMRTSPVATGFLLLAIAAGAVVTSALLPRRAWCRHLCPMGGLAGVCATSSLVELRPTADICSAKCSGHSCFKGDAHVEGCPMFQHVMFVDSNRDCVLCLDCVRLCPNGSPRLNLRLPARELWTGGATPPALARFVAMLLGLVVAQALIQAAEANPSAWGGLGAALERRHGVTVTLLLALCAGIPVAALRLAERKLDGEAIALLARRVVACAPLLAGGMAAYQLGNIPGLDQLRITLGGLAAMGVPDPFVSARLLPIARSCAVLAGLALSALTLWKLRAPSREPAPQP